MSVPSTRKRLLIVLQVLIWAFLGVLIFLYLPLASGVALPIQFWIKQVTIFTLLIAVYYINSLVLVPKLLLSNRTLLFILSAVLLALLFMMAITVSERWLELPEIMEQAFRGRGRPGPPPRPERLFDPFPLMISLLVLGISTSVTAIQKWQKDNQLRTLLEQEKVSSELAYLKSQINPHFFFNTLNNIYALMHVNIEGSKIALHKLSRMMRYLLYETQNESTLLSKEIAFLTDFIELMKLRLTAHTEVSYTEPGIVKDFTVSPMLFLPFIENAFKHGIDASRASRITVNFNVDGKVVEMEVSNTFYPRKTNGHDKQDSGIGLSNTKRRLNLLYPGKHKLSVAMDYKNSLYRVLLQIDFSKND